MSYANKYYDPVKAHEYYEKHKKLKGRRSTKGMTDSQKAMAGYVKDKLNTEKKQKIQEEFSKKKTDVTSKAKNFRTEINAGAKIEKSNIRKEYNNKYTEALQDIRNNVK